MVLAAILKGSHDSNINLRLKMKCKYVLDMKVKTHRREMSVCIGCSAFF